MRRVSDDHACASIPAARVNACIISVRVWRHCSVVRSFVIDPDDGELVRKLAGLHQIVEGRHDEPLGQIPTSAEDHQGGWRRLTAQEDLCRGLCGLRRNRCLGAHTATR